MTNRYLLFLIVLLSGCATPLKNLIDKPPQACFEEKCFDLELATTPEERMAGLQFRKSLPANKGMLFIFDDMSGSQEFWMKDTLIPLDMIWLDEEGQVIYVENEVHPCEQDPCETYGPDRPAKYVLELNAGQAQSLWVYRGYKVLLKL